MANLETTYMGLKLKNPLIVGASHLTADMDQIKKLEEAGAAAIVTKSLFEEQIHLDKLKFDEERERYYYRHPMMVTVGAPVEHGGPKEHLYWVERAKKECAIPVIASLNALDPDTWIEYAGRLADTGADALELNFYSSPRPLEQDASEAEKEQLDVIRAVTEAVNIPVSVKLSFFYTNPLHFIQAADRAGAKGLVLFNRLFQPEIDIQKETHVFPSHLSHAEDHRLPLRFTGLLADHVDADICSSTGIYQGEDAVKMILAGAACFQVVSTLIKHRSGRIGGILAGISDWMDEKGYADLNAFRGKMSKEKLPDPWAYTRAQYVQWIMHPERFIER